jgi:hypothetical protein
MDRTPLRLNDVATRPTAWALQCERRQRRIVTGESERIWKEATLACKGSHLSQTDRRLDAGRRGYSWTTRGPDEFARNSETFGATQESRHL